MGIQLVPTRLRARIFDLLVNISTVTRMKDFINHFIPERIPDVAKPMALAPRSGESASTWRFVETQLAVVKQVAKRTSDKQ